MFERPKIKQSRCRKCRQMCDSAILTADLSKVICYGCLVRPQEGRERLKGLQELAEIERQLDAEGILIGSAGLTVKEDDNSTGESQ